MGKFIFLFLFFLLLCVNKLTAENWVSYEGQLVPSSWINEIQQQKKMKEKNRAIIGNVHKKYLQFKLKKNYESSKKQLYLKSGSAQENVPGSDYSERLNKIVKKYLPGHQTSRKDEQMLKPDAKFQTAKKMTPGRKPVEIKKPAVVTAKKRPVKKPEREFITKIENLLLENNDADGHKRIKKPELPAKKTDKTKTPAKQINLQPEKKEYARNKQGVSNSFKKDLEKYLSFKTKLNHKKTPISKVTPKVEQTTQLNFSALKDKKKNLEKNEKEFFHNRYLNLVSKYLKKKKSSAGKH
ncbi:hypothetical protein ACFL35_13895 [Candidatus Riflebacteria bacterium]